MSTLGTVLLIILAVLIVLLIGLYFFGRKMQKKQAIQQEQMEAAKQNVTLVCEASIFDSLPVKREVKAVVSGLYITSVRGIRGSLETAPKKKAGFFARVKGKFSKK